MNAAVDAKKMIAKVGQFFLFSRLLYSLRRMALLGSGACGESTDQSGMDILIEVDLFSPRTIRSDMMKVIQENLQYA